MVDKDDLKALPVSSRPQTGAPAALPFSGTVEARDFS